MFSYVDLVRVEISLELMQQYRGAIPDEEMNGWLTLGDVARSVVGCVGGTMTESEVFDWVRTLMVEGYGATELAEISPDGDVFGDYDRATAWFGAAPYPHHLGDRWFATRPPEHPNASAAARAAPYYCAYGAPSDLRTLPHTWRTDTVISLASHISASLDFSVLPILADALQEVGCSNQIVLSHCHAPKATHHRGCWVIDLILGEGQYRIEPVEVGPPSR
jgi:hypothetical protein